MEDFEEEFKTRLRSIIGKLKPNYLWIFIAYVAGIVTVIMVEPMATIQLLFQILTFLLVILVWLRMPHIMKQKGVREQIDVGKPKPPTSCSECGSTRRHKITCSRHNEQKREKQ